MDTFIQNLARGAGAILRDGFRREIEVKHKAGFWDVVTKYDLASEKFLVERIKKKFPSHGILSEEGMNTENKKNFWVMDPLDGTRNFSRGLPFFCTSIAYVQDGKILLGVVYDPTREEMFFAKTGRGAYLNGKRTRIGQIDKLFFAVGTVEFTETIPKKDKKNMQRMALEENLWDQRICASALSLAYVGAGRYDYDISFGAFPWDYSAGALIAREGGAKVTDFRGRPHHYTFNQIVASHPNIHKQILKYLK